MHVDVADSQRLTRRIARADGRAPPPAREELRARRRRVTSASTPQGAGGGPATCAIAMERFGREDLAVVSYHMGIGNLENVLDAYGEGDASWTQVYFDATPDSTIQRPTACSPISATTRPPICGGCSPPGR